MSDIPQDIQRIIDAATAQGLEVEVYAESGGLIEASGSSVGAGAIASGDDLSSDFTGTPATIDLGGASATGGGFSRAFEGVGFTVPGGPSAVLLGAGVLILGGAAFAAYRARVGLALVAGALGAGLIGGAFYPPLFVLAALGLVVGALLYFRGDLTRGAVEQAFTRTAALIEADAPELKTKIKATTPARAKRAAGKLLKREGVS